MRCRACNAELNDQESTIKDFTTGEFLDLCSECLTVSRNAELELDEKWCYNVITKDTQATSEEPTD
jgi:hypothetical protein|tara:strand:- start:305 stop:502 length:198 start_codon:yes stop_codon:yes gene_type:complete